MNLTMKNGSVVINGTSIDCNGTVSIDSDGNVLVNGELKHTEIKKEIKVTINGNVDSIENKGGVVKVECSSGDIKTVSGDIYVYGGSGSITTMSGDILIKGAVNGNVQTVSGDVVCGDIGGNVSTVSGDVN